MFRAVKSLVAYPDGVTPVQLTEGEEVDLSPAFCEFLLHRNLIEPVEQKKPKRVAKKK
jgi:hypothetical protein